MAKLLDPKKVKISDKIKQWAEDQHVGRFVLRGDNPLMKNSLWTRSQRVSIKEGKGIIVRKLNGKSNELFLLGKLDDVEHDPLEENGTPYKKATVKYLNRIGEEESGAEDNLLELDEEDHVIFGNNDKWEPELQGNKDLLEILDAIFKVMVADFNRCLPRFLIKSRKELGKAEIKEIKNMWNSYDEPIVYFTKNKDDEDKWEPHDTDEWNPESRFADYKARFELLFGSLFRRLNNIKHNTSKKEERHNAREMMLVEDQFENPENIRLQESVNFLRECYEKFDGEKNNHYYELVVDDEPVFKIGDESWRENQNKSTKQQNSENQQTSTSEKIEKKEAKQNETKEKSENIRHEEKILHKN